MPRVIVLGSINQDIVTCVKSHPAVNEVVMASALHYYPGGRGANQAVAAASAGASTTMIGAVGNDAAGSALLEFLRSRNVATGPVRIIDGVPTGVAVVSVDDHGKFAITVTLGANDEVADDSNIEFTACDTLLSQFEVPIESIVSFFRRGKAAGATTVLNPAPNGVITGELAELVDVIVVNEQELADLTGEEIDEESELMKITSAARSLCANSHDRRVVVRVGNRGSILVSKNDFEAVTSQEGNVVDSTGSGDCFVGSMAARLSRGDKLTDALSYANRAALISGKREGAGSSMPTAEEVRAFIGYS